MRPKSCCETHTDTLYFNPRTHVGCDTRARNSLSPFAQFQSTHPRGVRHARGHTSPCHWRFQSTHPRGVRPLKKTIYIMTNCHFNPRTHVGCDLKFFKKCFKIFKFQSTHPRGVRLRKSVKILRKRDFNPRTHVGCDLSLRLAEIIPIISIHAPTWGATVKPSNGWLLGHKDNEFANENIIIINSVNIT